MYKVHFSKECGCVKKHGFGGNREFDSKEEAKEEGMHLVEKMNDIFCKKHHFALQENGTDYLIQVTDNR